MKCDATREAKFSSLTWVADQRVEWIASERKVESELRFPATRMIVIHKDWGWLLSFVVYETFLSSLYDRRLLLGCTKPHWSVWLGKSPPLVGVLFLQTRLNCSGLRDFPDFENRGMWKTMSVKQGRQIRNNSLHDWATEQLSLFTPRPGDASFPGPVQGQGSTVSVGKMSRVDVPTAAVASKAICGRPSTPLT